MSSTSTPLALRLRRVARALRHTPDRSLHRLRRRARLKQVQRLGLPRSVLFVCHGNICRSPYAEMVFARALPRELREYMFVTSAGFIDPDRGSPENALTVASARGIDLQPHRSRLLTREMVRTMDLMVVMDTTQRKNIRLWFGADPRRVLVLGDLDPLPIDTRTVRDPVFQRCEVFADTYARIDRCVATLLAAITGAPAPLPWPEVQTQEPESSWHGTEAAEVA
jgi:protein-tyrosine phosphatase